VRVHEGIGFDPLGQAPEPGCIRLVLPPSRLKFPVSPAEEVALIKTAREKYLKTGDKAQYDRETLAVRQRQIARGTAFRKAARREEVERRRELDRVIGQLESAGWTTKEVKRTRPGRGGRYTITERYICPPIEEDDEEEAGTEGMVREGLGRLYYSHGVFRIPRYPSQPQSIFGLEDLGRPGEDELMRISDIGTSIQVPVAYPFSGRVEVKDAEAGTYVKDATVMLKGGPQDLVDITDSGGNASFTNATLFSLSPTYTVIASGYATRTVPAKNREVVTIGIIKQTQAAPSPWSKITEAGKQIATTMPIKGRKTSTTRFTQTQETQSAGTQAAGSGIPMWVWAAVGGVVLVGVVILLAKK